MAKQAPTQPYCPSWLDGDSVSTEVLRQEVERCREKLMQEDSAGSQLEGADKLYALVMCIWSLQVGQAARTAADFVCDELRENGSLSRLLHLCAPPEKSLQFAVLRTFEQVMVPDNRSFIVAHNQFDTLIATCCSHESENMIRCGTGILENLFKESAETCLRLIQSGGLEGITFGCRSSDPETLQHCAAALANCAMYGGHKAQVAMISREYNAEHWLFPLAFCDDAVVKYYALLAISFLAANEVIAEQVAKSGTLDLVLPFLNAQDPEDFSKRFFNHVHGRSEGWLRRLVPLLSSESEEARSIAAFHFAMEVGIKKKQMRLDIFDNIGAIEKLQSGSHLTASLCCQALTMAERDLPEYQCWDVLQWTPEQVSEWTYDCSGIPAFSKNYITGNMLVDITVNDLLDIGYSQSKLECKAFLEHVRALRCHADVSSKDRDGVCKWLTSVSQDLAVYHVDFVRCGITKALLPHLTADLLKEIGVRSSIDQLKILVALRELPDHVAHDTPDASAAKPSFILLPIHRECYDIFICYRRATGSQLASLLRVHLHLRGLNVFLDVSDLGEGKFDDNLLTTISRAHNVVVVLSPHSLDRCFSDAHARDWVHRELLCALDNRVNVVPVTAEGFTWPREDKLPSDIRPISKMNAVSWSHEYQDASVEKLVTFLHLPQASAGSRQQKSVSSLGSVKSVEPSKEITV